MKKQVTTFLTVALLFFGFNVIAQPVNDDFANAIDVTSIINSCSADAAYTTINATSDLNAGSTWNTSPDYNVWFSFTAPASGIATVTVDRGGSKGTLRRAQVAIWDNIGTTEINSNRYVNDNDVVSTTAISLTPGNTYYISVDNNYSGYRGTFTLCLSDAADYDFYEGAEDVTALINTCSADEAYTTTGATGDLNAASCWNTSPNYNRWFSFTAPASGMMTVTVDRGGSKGTMRRTNVAIWEADGTTEVTCNRYVNDNDVVSTTALGLTPGNTYYISVDNNYSGYRGTFTLCLSDAADYDFYEGAEDVTALINTCSADEAYTTTGATGDLNAASCWNTSPNYNRWFSFTAPASGMMTVTVDRGGSKGTMRRTNVAIWEADGTTEVTCNRYVNDNDVVSTTALGLTPGNTYYISVDNNYSGYRGTFTLCLSDAADYDFYEGAEDVTALINTCSADEAYTTTGATGDLNAASCWNTSPNYNRWFSFTAPASGMMTVTVDRGGSKGTMRRTNVAIWESDGTTEVTCNRYVNDNDVVSTTALGLTPGNTYYISVDNNYSGYRGTFTLCLSDAADYDFYEGAEDVTALINTCSADEAYTTTGATGDLNAASCWNTSPNYNRWFSFTAPASGMMTVTVDRGGSKGTMRRTNVAIWEADGTTEVTCNRYVNDNDVVSTTALSLTPGNTYYISVDNNYSGYRGTFTLCLSDAADYDFYEGAEDVTALINTCSADEAYTTTGATGDLNAASCWNTSPNYNRWFSFTAPASGMMTVTVDRGGSKGTMRRTNVAIWEADGTTEVTCNRYVNDNDVVSTTALSLTPGNTYYISVDNDYSGYRGTFTLCLSDQSDYDFYEGAIELNDLDNWCSADAEFTTIGATGDLNAASCWNTSPNYNRWFKFTAVSSSVTIEVRRGGSEGTIRRINLALFEANGTTEVDCQRYSADNDNVSIVTSGLTVGNTYYISVDNNYSGYRGTFTLCVDNINQTYYSINSGAWNSGSNWSLVDHSGAAAGTYPTIGDLAEIEGHTMTITSNEDLAEIQLIAATNNTGLTVSNGTLDLDGRLILTNTGNNFNLTLTISNSTVNVGNDFTINRNGGSANISATISNSNLTINDDFSIFSTAGTGDNTINVSTLTGFIVGGELVLSNTGGPRSSISVDNSNMTISDDLTFTASADNLVELSLSTGSDLYLETDILRGSPAYGILSSSGNSNVHFIGNSPQVLASGGSGTGDAIAYENIIINNSSGMSPQVTLGDDLDISGTLTLTDGILLSSGSNLLTFLDGSSVSGGSNNSFIDGLVRKIGNTPFTFQIGDNNKWAPLGINNLTGDAATEFYAEYHHTAYSDISNFRSPDPNGVLTNVSAVEYWTLDQAGTVSSADVTLHWKDQSESGITDYADLEIAHYHSTNMEWENFGQDNIQMTDPGSITVNGVSSFSPFTFGSTGSNPLPVELVSFDYEMVSNSVNLLWSTATELNNDRFEIERSLDGKNFNKIGSVKGHGSSTSKTNYEYLDLNPYLGNAYYRLKQIDFDGTYSYSKSINVNNNSGSFAVFPNPVLDGTLNVSLNTGAEGVATVKLIDARGSIVFYYQYKEDSGKMTQIKLDVSDLKAGLYVLKAQVDNENVVKRVMIK